MDNATVRELHPLFGVEIRDLEISTINKDTDEAAVQQLKDLVHKHKVVVIRNQPVLTAEQQIRISEWFGEVEDAGFEQHVKSPHRLILRVSNDEAHGFTQFGTSGFHIDGSFMDNPNDFSIYHLVQKPRQGTTAFVDLHGVFCSLTQDDRLSWQRLWLVKTFKNILGLTEYPGYVIHPLVYKHPATGSHTLCIHQGKTSGFVQDWGVNIGRMFSKEETIDTLSMIDKALATDDNKFQYHHKWEAGDLIISDNRAVAHMALPDTQASCSNVGLRIMHRTVIRGTNRPWTDARQCITRWCLLHKDCIDIQDVEDEDENSIQCYSSGDLVKWKRLIKALKTSTL